MADEFEVPEGEQQEAPPPDGDTFDIPEEGQETGGDEDGQDISPPLDLDDPCFELPADEVADCLGIETETDEWDDLQDILDISIELEGIGFGGGGGVGKQIDDLLAQIEPGGGGGGGYGGDLNRYANEIDEILLQLQDLADGGLPLLDEESQAELDLILENRLAEVEAQINVDTSELVARLFGKGFNDSSVSATLIAQFEESAERVRQAVYADDAALRLDFRRDIRDALMSNLSLQASVLGQQQSVALERMALAQEKYLTLRGQNIQLLTTQMNNSAMLSAERMRTSAQLQLGELDAKLRKAGLLLEGKLGMRELDLSELSIRNQFNIALKELDLKRRELALMERDSRRRRKSSMFGALGSIAATIGMGIATGTIP